jgi:hypothetical protein
LNIRSVHRYRDEGTGGFHFCFGSLSDRMSWDLGIYFYLYGWIKMSSSTSFRSDFKTVDFDLRLYCTVYISSNVWQKLTIFQSVFGGDPPIRWPKSHSSSNHSSISPFEIPFPLPTVISILFQLATES